MEINFKEEIVEPWDMMQTEFEFKWDIIHKKKAVTHSDV